MFSLAPEWSTLPPPFSLRVSYLGGMKQEAALWVNFFILLGSTIIGKRQSGAKLNTRFLRNKVLVQ